MGDWSCQSPSQQVIQTEAHPRLCLGGPRLIVVIEGRGVVVDGSKQLLLGDVVHRPGLEVQTALHHVDQVTQVYQLSGQPTAVTAAGGQSKGQHMSHLSTSCYCLPFYCLLSFIFSCHQRLLTEKAVWVYFLYSHHHMLPQGSQHYNMQ